MVTYNQIENLNQRIEKLIYFIQLLEKGDYFDPLTGQTVLLTDSQKASIENRINTLLNNIKTFVASLV